MVVLGNGPSLKAENVPPDALPIGVNRAYEEVWCPIVVSGDSAAMYDQYAKAEALLYVWGFQWDKEPGCHLPRVWCFAKPLGNTSSGEFGYYWAQQMRPRRIYLLGFDREGGHFDGSASVKDYRKCERFLCKLWREGTWRWDGGGYVEWDGKPWV